MRLRTAAMSVITVLAIASSGCGPPLAPPPMMTFAEYAKRDHRAPYVVTLTARNGARLLYYGSEPVYDAADSTVADLQARWKTFDPSYALNEGGNPPIAPTVEETVGRNGEPALVRWLANRSHVHVDSIDPAPADIVARLQGRFTSEQIKVAMALRRVAERRRRTERFRSADLDRDIGTSLDVLGQLPTLDGSPKNLAELSESSARLLPELGDWREVPATWFDPAPDPPPTWINEMMRVENDYRDEFMIERIMSQLAQRDHVFAVAGLAHVVMQERTLRSRAQHLGEVAHPH